MAASNFNNFRRGEPFPGFPKDATSYYRTNAPIRVAGFNGYVYTASGGMVFGGRVATAVTLVYSASGSLHLGGISPATSLIALYTPSGGLALGSITQPKITLPLIPTGGIVVASGTNTVVPYYIYITSGAVVVDNSADYMVIAASYIYVALFQSMRLGSAAPFIFTAPGYTASGSLVFGNSGISLQKYSSSTLGSLRLLDGGSTSYLASDFMVFIPSGPALHFTNVTANLAFSNWVYTPVFGFGPRRRAPLRLFGPAYGTFLVAAYWSYTPVFGFGPSTHAPLRTNGIADLAFSNWVYTPVFGFGPRRRAPLTLFGFATDIQPFYVYPSSGDDALQTGSSADSFRSHISFGGLVLGGAASLDCGLFCPATGNLRLGGGVICQARLILPSSGGLTLASGDARVTVIRRIVPASAGMVIGGTSHSTSDKYGYVPSSVSLNIYTPSYYEAISYQQPLGFWWLDDSNLTAINYGSLGSSINGTYSTAAIPQQQVSLIPNQQDAHSVEFGMPSWNIPIPDSSSFNNTIVPQRSISLVFRCNDVNNPPHQVLYKEGNTIIGFNVYIASGQLYSHIYNVFPANAFDGVIKTAISSNTNYHVLVVFDAATNLLRGYINGQVFDSGDATIVFSAQQYLDAHAPASIGGKVNGTRYNDAGTSISSPGTGHSVAGFVQAVAVWDRQVVDSEEAIQHSALAARYGITLAYQCSGGMVLGGGGGYPTTTTYSVSGGMVLSNNVASTRYAVAAMAVGGGLVFGGTTDAIAIISFYPYGAAGNIVIGGVSDVVVNQWNFIASGAGVVFGGGVSLITSYDYEIVTGALVFGGISNTISDNYSYTSDSANLLLGNSSVSILVTVFTPLVGGGMVLGGVSDNSMPPIVIATGGMVLGGSVSTSYTFEVDRAITWNISQGILRYYRVEGKGKPFVCPPVGGDTCRTDQCVKYVVNVQAHTVSEVCRKLKDQNFPGPIQRIQVFSIPVLKNDLDPNSDPNCNIVSDVNPNVPDCLDLLVDFVGVVAAGVSAKVFIVTAYTYVGKGNIRVSSSSEVIVNNWAYVASGSINSTGISDFSSPQYQIVVGSGGISVDGSAFSVNSYGGELVVAAGIATQVVEQGVAYGFQTTSVLVPVQGLVDSQCCGNLPVLLYITHQFGRLVKLTRFLNINDLTINRNLKLVYSKKHNTWIWNQHFRGISALNQSESWDLVAEFGCLKNVGFPITGNAWGFSIAVQNRNLVTMADYYTRILVTFDPVQACTFDNTLSFSFSLNTKLRTLSPTSLNAAVVFDEIGLFNGGDFAINPNVIFAVSSSPSLAATTLIDFTNSLEELLV